MLLPKEFVGYLAKQIVKQLSPLTLEVTDPADACVSHLLTAEGRDDLRIRTQTQAAVCQTQRESQSGIGDLTRIAQRRSLAHAFGVRVLGDLTVQAANDEDRAQGEAKADARQSGAE